MMPAFLSASELLLPYLPSFRGIAKLEHSGLSASISI